ncbi:hypothetical protein LSTR_LSTR003299 [Laodelphax striatellus]|uniref:Uncharacterized protein n=1 Tax=Laodelphax striatellus TaxID=195883 RepID=A0A482XU14_LAOST|nr:hypothetical protein LSTR_LSTR003299 [Laodelphax striatellus]
MISRCQSDIILSNRFIETHYKRVDKSIEKCKALLRGIQKEFKKTRDFWEQLKANENSVTEKSELSSGSHTYSDSKNSEDSTKNEDVDLRNKLEVGNVCSKKAKGNAVTSSKKADELSENSPKVTENISKNVEDLQEEDNSFSKISKLDVKHLEAFLDIVQKTQVSQGRNKNESNSIEDYSSDLETFEDALCQLSSVTSLTFDSFSSSDVENERNLVEKRTRAVHDGEENLSSNRFQLYSDVKLPTSLTIEISRLDKTYTYNNDNNSLENSRKNVDDIAGSIVPNISESGSLKNETKKPSFDDSDSDVYHEACDFTETIEENESSPFFFHANVSKSGIFEAKIENTKKFDLGNDKIVRADCRLTNCRKLLDTKGSKNEKVVKFSGNNQITYRNEPRSNGSRVERDKGEFHKYQKKYSQMGKQIENRSRSRIRVTKQRNLIKVRQKDRTRSRSRKKSYHDIAVGTSDLDLFEYFNQWPQRVLQRDPFYSLPAKRRHFDYSTEQPSGIFHPSFLQPYNLSDKYNGNPAEHELLVKKTPSWNSIFKYNGKPVENELIVKKIPSWNSLFKQPLSNNELSDNGSNTTYSIKRTSSSDQGNFSTKLGDHLSEDRFSIHNSTILNNSNTNIFVFRTYEDRFKPPAQASDSDGEIRFNAKKPVDQNVYSGSESSRGRASSTDRKLKRKKYLTAKSRKQGALNDEKNNLSREIKQKDFGNSKEATVSKIQAVIPYVGHIHIDHIEVPQCTQLMNETKILQCRHSLVYSMRNCSYETLKNNEWVIRKQKRLSVGESDLVGKKNIDVIFNNKSQPSLDLEKQRLPSTEKSIRRPSSSPLTFSSKDAGIKHSSKEDCRLQLVNGRGDIHLSEVLQKSPYNSATSLNREYTVSKIDRTSTKPALEPKVVFKISASSDDLRREKLNSNEHLATINLTKSSSSCSGIESEAFSKMKMKKFGKNYLSCNDLMGDDQFYSKINIIPLPGDDKGLIQQVSIVGQRLWVQGATISSSFKNSFTEQEEEKKPETNKNSTGSDDSRPATSSKKSDDNSNEKSDKPTKNNDNVIKEVAKKKPVYTPHIKVNKKNETTESKPRFCPYVNKNYSTIPLPTNKHNCKASNRNKTPERKAQLSPTQPSVKAKVEDKFKVNEKEKVAENNGKYSNIAAPVHDSSNSDNFMHDTENCNNLPVPNTKVRCGQALSVVNDGSNTSRENDSDNNSLNMNSENRIDDRDNVKALDKSNKNLSNNILDESLVVNSSIKTTSKMSNNENDHGIGNSGAKINQNSEGDSGDSTVTRRRSQQSKLDFDRHNKQDPRRSPGKTVRFKKRSPSNGRESSSEESIDQLEEVKRVRHNLCSILPNDCLFKQALLKKLDGVDRKRTGVNRVNNEEVDVFGAPLTNTTGGPFYNDHGYPIAQMSGVSLYNSKGVPTKGAYGRPLHTTLKKELAKIVEGSEERRNVFHRMNRNFEEQLLQTLQTTTNWKIDEFGRVYDSYGRPLFDRYGYLLYDHIGNPLTDAFGRKLTDKYGISIMGPRKKCANVMLTTLSSNESLYPHQSSDERLVKNRTELINKKKDISKENIWKKCKRQVSFNMDPTIITLNSDSEGETLATNFKR